MFNVTSVSREQKGLLQEGQYLCDSLQSPAGTQISHNNVTMEKGVSDFSHDDVTIEL
jgi:hypothetical protein